MLTTKKFFLLCLLLGALLIAGLFLLQRPSSTDQLAEVKPSQLNFTGSNQISDHKMTLPSGDIEKKVTPDPAQIIEKVQQLQGEDQKKWAVVESILASKNDNDPRMDRDLKKMNPVIHELLYAKYETLPAEDHNGRGLIVFLIARDLNSIEDTQFLKKIYQETPCLSMADCKTQAAEDPHFSGMNQTSLTYAQQSGLYMIDRQLADRPSLLSNPESRSGIIQVLVQAENFPVPVVQEQARAIRTKYGL